MKDAVKPDELSDEIWAAIGLTINTGNFNSLRVDAGSRKTVNGGENREEAWQSLWDEIDQQLAVKIAEAKKDLESE